MRFCTMRGALSTVSVSDADALAAFQRLSRLEGIIPALESAHAVAHAIEVCEGSAARSDRDRQSFGARR